jgi:hypothetical protein
MTRFLTIAIGWLNGQAKFQKLSHRGGAGRHPVFETEVVHDRQFARREHDLQTFIPDIIHCRYPNLDN